MFVLSCFLLNFKYINFVCTHQRQKAPAIVVKEIALMSPIVHITMKKL